MQPRPSAETSSPCDPSFMRGTTTRDDTTAAAAAMAIDRDGMVLLLLSLLLQLLAASECSVTRACSSQNLY